MRQKRTQLSRKKMQENQVNKIEDPFSAPHDVGFLRFKFILCKRYFDQGYGMTSYLKYIIALFGISSLDVKSTLIMGFAYAIFCFMVGFLWFKFGFFEIDTEISNRFNRFVREMREINSKTQNGK